MSQQQREPIFNVPGIVVALVATFIAIHAGLSLMDEGTQAWLLNLLAFNPARYSGPPVALPGEPWAGAAGFLTHAFLHGDLSHLAINSVWLLAVGSPIARRMPAISFLAFFAMCALGGALLFMLFHTGLDTAMVGASGAISGLMAAALRLVFAAEDDHARMVLREDPAAAPSMSIRETFTRRRPLTAIIVWIVINFVAAVAMGPMTGGAGIAWEAHLGGFFAGLFTFDLFDRGRRGDEAHES